MLIAALSSRIYLSLFFESRSPLRWQDYTGAHVRSRLLEPCEECLLPKLAKMEKYLSSLLPEPLPQAYANFNVPRPSAELLEVISENGGESIECLNALFAEGRIRIGAKLKLEDSGAIRISLSMPTISESYRFARQYGSDRMLRIKLDEGSTRTMETPESSRTSWRGLWRY